MASFGKASSDKLKGVHPDLVKVMEEAIKDSPVDFSIVYGVRTTQEQKDLYALGRTKVNPDGKSKSKPMGNIVTQKDGVKNRSNHQAKSDGLGRAVDIVPYINGGIRWEATNEFNILASHILATAKRLGVKIRWGADWDMDGKTRAQGDKDENLVDLPHYELI